ncbi:integrase core domain-containing protein [Desulfobaculum sp. SPO524]|uniref:integrase core domain-containing protein n=1 Tax=Desulfobaculum sp. SPO524 TaxID=3378071 RepID=UPI003854E43F
MSKTRRTYREEVLDFYLFNTLNEVQEVTGNWIKEYNEERPHGTLGKIMSVEFTDTRSS